MSSQEKDLHRASRFVGISRDSYKLCRQLLLIKSRGLLTATEKETVDKAIGLLSSGHRTAASAAVVDILRRYWKTGTRDGSYRERSGHGRIKSVAIDAKRRTRFDKKIFYIREICSGDDEMNVPLDLTDVERQEIIETLSTSIGFLSQLTARVNRKDEGDE
jgi:hypothetical protein